jgi:hypothetical protein
MNLVDELYGITAALSAAGVRYAVCGGVAVTIHGATRSTEAAFEGALDDRIEVQLPAGPCKVVSRAMLIRMKRLAGRAQDLADIEKLEGARE